MITIVTGEKGIGKTTFLLKLIEDKKNKGKTPTGIMTPAVYDEDERKVGFYALNIAIGEQWELGRSDKKLDGPSYGPFSFSERGFIRANEILGKVLAKGSSDVFLDEIGPLELEKGYGFSSILPLIISFNSNRNLYLVIRRSLIDNFVSRFVSDKEYRVFEITMENREGIEILK